jgi:SNF2 family DNA or RNA helicase
MDFKKYTNLLAYITRMRKLTGLAKVVPAFEYLEDFLEQTDRKIVVFTHHIDVANNLIFALAEHKNQVLHMPAEVKDERRDDMIKEFQNNPEKRILIASTLSGAEGTDGLQLSCSDMMFLERQWNPANEEQAEARLERIGQLQNKITAVYCVAVGTIDEYFATLVEQKRQYVKQTLGSMDVVAWEETSLMKELMEVLAAKGLKKWNLKTAHAKTEVTVE